MSTNGRIKIVGQHPSFWYFMHNQYLTITNTWIKNFVIKLPDFLKYVLKKLSYSTLMHWIYCCCDYLYKNKNTLVIHFRIILNDLKLIILFIWNYFLNLETRKFSIWYNFHNAGRIISSISKVIDDKYDSKSYILY